MIRQCKECGRGNRVPPQYLAQQGRCGACQAPLPPLSDAPDVQAQDFESIIQEARVPVLVDFWAPWCGPCKMAAPQVAEAARQLAGEALVIKLNTEEHPAIAARFNVRSIPFFAVFRDGALVAQRSGLAGHSELIQWLRAQA